MLPKEEQRIVRSISLFGEAQRVRLASRYGRRSPVGKKQPVAIHPNILTSVSGHDCFTISSNSSISRRRRAISSCVGDM